MREREMRESEREREREREGAVRDLVGIWSGAISDIVKLSSYAARSIG